VARGRRWQLARAASNCGAIATLSSFLSSVTLRGGLPHPKYRRIGGLIKDVRTLVAKHLGVSVDRVTDEAHFTNDLGADWLDRLELMMVVEDQFAGVEITGADVDRIKVVGDLIRHLETVDKERRRQGAAPVVRKLFGPRLAHTVNLTKQQKGCEEVALFF